MDFDFAGKGYGRSPGTSHGILHELVDQKADGDSNGVFFNRRQTLKHLVQLLELSSGITQRAETQGLPVRDGILTHFHFLCWLRFRSTRYLCISPQIHPQNVNVFGDAQTCPELSRHVQTCPDILENPNNTSQQFAQRNRAETIRKQTFAYFQKLPKITCTSKLKPLVRLEYCSQQIVPFDLQI